jgi:hypothetical protein
MDAWLLNVRLETGAYDLGAINHRFWTTLETSI